MLKTEREIYDNDELLIGSKDVNAMTLYKVINSEQSRMNDCIFMVTPDKNNVIWFESWFDLDGTSGHDDIEILDENSVKFSKFNGKITIQNVDDTFL